MINKNRIHLMLALNGSHVFENVRGKFYTVHSVNNLVKAITNKTPEIQSAVENLEIVSAGLQADESGDFIGGTVITITPEMIGKNVMVFTSLSISDQYAFIDFVKRRGGIAGIVKDEKDAIKIIGNYC